MNTAKNVEEIQMLEQQLRNREVRAKELETELDARDREIRAQRESLNDIIEERVRAIIDKRLANEKMSKGDNNKGDSNNFESNKNTERVDSARTGNNSQFQPEVQDQNNRQEVYKRNSATTSKNDFTAITLRDCVNIVPTFDGVKPPAIQFVRACKRAALLGPHFPEIALVTMIKTKLTRQALSALEDYYCEKVASFTDRLMHIFALARSTNYYRGQLANSYQEAGEPILEYISRIKDLHYMIVDREERENYGELMPNRSAEIGNEVCESFVDGLLPSLRDTILTRGFTDVEDAMDKAISLAKFAERDQERYGQQLSLTYPSSRSPRANFDRFPPRNDYYAQEGAPQRNFNHRENRSFPTNDYNRGNQYPRNDRATQREFQNQRNDGPRENRTPQRDIPYRNERSPRENRFSEQVRNDRNERGPRFENQRCAYCGIPGHAQPECRKYARDYPSGNDSRPTIDRDPIQGPSATRPVRHAISATFEPTSSDPQTSSQQFETSE